MNVIQGQAKNIWSRVGGNVRSNKEDNIELSAKSSMTIDKNGR